MTKHLLLLLQLTTLLSLSGCDWFKKSTTTTDKEAAALAEADSALIPHITSEEHFTKFLAETSKIVALKVDAPWCSACKYLHPLLVEVAKQTPDIAFARLNIDQVTSIAQQHNVIGIPTILFFKDGKEIPNSRIEGADVKDAQELLEKIRMATKQTGAAAVTVPQEEVTKIESKELSN